jgi:hypothetical protein
MPVAVAVLIDVVLVIVFVALGRGSHDEGSALSGTIEIAAPFLIALAVGWMAGRKWWRTPTSVELGVTLWAVTLTIGMVLRRTVFDRGTAIAFVIVAALFLAFFLVGWRIVAAKLMSRRADSVAR